PAQVRTLLLCQGKIYYELEARKEQEGADDVASVRLEQLYPLPAGALEAVFARYGKAKDVRWVQEEPANMGAMSYLGDRLHRLKGAPMPADMRWIARRPSGPPATGSGVRSALQQQRIIEEAFT